MFGGLAPESTPQRARDFSPPSFDLSPRLTREPRRSTMFQLPELSPVAADTEEEEGGPPPPPPPTNTLEQEAKTDTNVVFQDTSRLDFEKQRLISEMLEKEEYVPLKRGPSRRNPEGTPYTRDTLESMTLETLRQKHSKTMKNAREGKVVRSSAGPTFEGGEGEVAVRAWQTLSDADLAREVAEATANVERFPGVYALEQTLESLRREVARRRQR